MTDKLMPVQVEIYPLIVSATLAASEDAPVEASCLRNVPDLDRNVEGSQSLHTGVLQGKAYHSREIMAADT
jgi:hypothetical protein